jgi:hypothetical protein
MVTYRTLLHILVFYNAIITYYLGRRVFRYHSDDDEDDDYNIYNDFKVFPITGHEGPKGE